MTSAVLELSANGKKLAAEIERIFGGVAQDAGALGSQIAANFERAATPGLKKIEKQFADTVRRAMEAGSNGANINLDLPGLRTSVQELERKATISRMLATAQTELASSSNGVTAAMQREAAAVQAVANRDEEAARAAREQLLALEQLQERLGGVSAAQRNAAVGSASFRVGLQSVGYQANDFVVQIAGGTSAIRAFSLQMPQLIQALQMMGQNADGATTRFGRFLGVMSGPWGIALSVAIPLAGMLAERMMAVSKATEEARKASEKFADGLLDVNQFADKTTGKMLSLADATIRAAVAMTQLKQGALGQKAEGLQDKGFQAALKASSKGKDEARGGPEGTANYHWITKYDKDIAAAMRKAGGPDGNLIVLDRELAAVAKRRPELKGLSDEVARLAAESIAAAKEAKQLQQNVDFLTGKRSTVPGFEPKKEKTSNTLAQAAKLAEAGEDLAKKIANITDRFSDLTDGTAESQRALRELADLESDLKNDTKKQPANAAALLQQIEAARKIVSEAPARRAQESIDKELQKLKDVADVEATRARLGDVEAAKLEARLRLIRQFPEATEEQIAPLVKIAQLEAARVENAKALRDYWSEFAKYLNEQKEAQKQRDEEQKRKQDDLAANFERAFRGGVDSIWDHFAELGYQNIATIAQQLAKDIKIKGIDLSGIASSDRLKQLAGTAGTGVAIAQATGGSKVGGAIGGILGEAGGKALGSALGSTLGKLGSALGPIGAIVGSVLGSVLPGLLMKAPRAVAVVTSTSGQSQVTGNDKNAQAAVSGISVNLQSALERIIGQLGGTPGAFQVSIGQYKDTYRVKSDGSASAGNKHPGDANLIYNGTDGNEALRIAILDAVRDGAVQGIRDGSRNLITSNQDIDQGLSKALKYEQAFKDLKKLTDPVGAAIDEVTLKFRQLRDIAKEAGTSTEDMAKLQDLYRRELEAAKKASGGAAEGLKSFLKELQIGSNSPLSLRDQEKAAREVLQPFKDQILAGKSVDNDAFQKAAQAFLDIERQLNGSSQSYFDQYDLVRSLTEKAIAQIDAQASTAADAQDPFTSAIASSTQATANLLEQQNQQMAQQTELLRQMAETYGGSGFVTAQRGYY